MRPPFCPIPGLVVGAQDGVAATIRPPYLLTGYLNGPGSGLRGSIWSRMAV